MPNSSKKLLHFATFGDESKTAVVFLHGFLGSFEDWSKVISLVKNDYFCVALDLPGHGKSANLSCMSFDHASQLISNTISFALQNKPYYLLGYSLGGRIAMHMAVTRAASNLQGLIIESSHVGLAKNEKMIRLEHDKKWATRFETEPLAQVLIDWYKQSVFISLTENQKRELIAKRVQACKSAFYGQALSKMLLATSLSKQNRIKVENIKQPMLYLCGEQDIKFIQLAESLAISYKKVKQAGHNIHFEQVEIFTSLILQWLVEQDRNI